MAAIRVVRANLAVSSLELLRQLDEFLPRINFGKPVSERAVPAPSPADGAGFSYLKRDLVRMLGVLSHESRSVQDRVREAGGLPVVMNLCVIDERNPCAPCSIPRVCTAC